MQNRQLYKVKDKNIAFASSEVNQEELTTCSVCVTTRKVASYIILVVYVCRMTTFESLDVGSLFSHILYISRGYESSSYMKVIRSRSQEHKRLKIPIPAM